MRSASSRSQSGNDTDSASVVVDWYAARSHEYSLGDTLSLTAVLEVILSLRNAQRTCAARRAALLARLRRNAPGCWARTGMHETRGTIMLLNALWPVTTTLVEHEEAH